MRSSKRKSTMRRSTTRRSTTRRSTRRRSTRRRSTRRRSTRRRSTRRGQYGGDVKKKLLPLSFILNPDYVDQSTGFFLIDNNNLKITTNHKIISIDVSPLIRRSVYIRKWGNNEMMDILRASDENNEVNVFISDTGH